MGSKNPKIVGTIDNHPVTYTIEDHGNEMVVELYSSITPDDYPVGRIITQWKFEYAEDDDGEYENTHCDAEVEDLKERLAGSYPDIEDGYEVFVTNADLFREEVYGMGLGSAMYEIVIRALWDYLQYPFFLLPDFCKGSTTSEMATRVWKSLAKKYPSQVIPDYRIPPYIKGLGVLAIVKNPPPYQPQDFKRKRRNPKPIKTKLVPPTQVRLVGFPSKKTKIVEKHIPVALKAVQNVFKTRSKFPTPIYPMEPAEIHEGRSTIDKGHPKGAGHGMYFPDYQLVKINPNMEPIDILANVVHENIHHVDPSMRELKVRDLTIRIMGEVFGIPTDGRPYAK